MNRSTFGIIRFLVSQAPLVFLGLATLCVFSALTEGLSISLLVPLVDDPHGDGSAAFSQTPVLGSLSAYFVGQSVNDRLCFTAGALAILALMRGAILFCRSFGQRYLELSVSQNLSLRSYRRFCSLPMDEVASGESSTFAKLMYIYPLEAGPMLGQCVQGLSCILTFLVYLVFLLSISAIITVWVAIFLGGAFLFVNLASSKALRKAGQRSNEVALRMYHWVHETARSFSFLKAMGMEGKADRRYVLRLGDYIQAAKKEAAVACSVDPILNSTLLLGLASILFAGSFVLKGEQEKIPQILVFIVILGRMVPFVSILNLARTQVSTWNHKGWMLVDFLAYRADLDEPESKEDLRIRGGELVLERLSFTYPDKQVPVLHELQAHFPAGAVTALVGESGAGKSTLVKLLLGLYTPSAGAILVDGQDLSEVDRGSWAQHLAYVPQDPPLFDDSIGNNLRFVKEDATDGEIREACLLAHADPFIRDLPDGYDTQLGENGVKLSGGQRQRLAIARALLLKPKVLVLDEATSNLDSISEAYIRRTIRSLEGRVTVILIAHRLNNVRDADQILFLEKGQISRSGQHADLMESNERYKEMVELQRV